MAPVPPVTSASASTTAPMAPAPVPAQTGTAPSSAPRLTYEPLVFHPAAAALDAFSAPVCQPDVIPDSDPETPYLPHSAATYNDDDEASLATSSSGQSEVEAGAVSDESDTEEQAEAPLVEGEAHP